MQLAKSLVADKEKGLVFLNRATERQTILPHAEWRNGGLACQVEVIEVPRIEDGIPKISKDCAVEVVCTRFGFYIDLTARLRTVLGIV